MFKSERRLQYAKKPLPFVKKSDAAHIRLERVFDIQLKCVRQIGTEDQNNFNSQTMKLFHLHSSDLVTSAKTTRIAFLTKLRRMLPKKFAFEETGQME